MRLSVIIPAYNEGQHIYDNLLIVTKCVETFSSDFEILAVNDGSKDNTYEQMSKASLEDSRIRPITYECNRGKGGAIVEGVNQANGDVIAFLDADLDLSPEHIRAFLKRMEEANCDVVIGSKMHKESNLEYPTSRKIFSFCYFIMLKILFGLRVKDTQTGVKLYRAELIKRIATVQRIDGYAFDIELLAMANYLGATIEEMPIELKFSRENAFGRIRFKDIVRMFLDTIDIWWNLRIQKTYKI